MRYASMAEHQGLSISSDTRLPAGKWRPSWKRPGLPKKATLVGTLCKDNSPLREPEAQGTGQRILQLEKNLLFLREQHRDTLEQLHKETERLKAENRELSFKLVMCRCGGKSEVGSLEDELRTIRACLAQERAKSKQLKSIIERKVLENQRSVDQTEGDSTARMPTVVGGRPPTLAECDGLIKHLQMTNYQQSHELQQIKADLRDVLYSHKWTPDAFLLARAYVSTDTGADSVPNGLPKIAPTSTMFERAYRCVREEVTLPALKPHITNSFPDRQKGTQALHRSKLGRSIP